MVVKLLLGHAKVLFERITVRNRIRVISNGPLVFPRILHIPLRSLYELVVGDKHEKLLSDEGIAFNCVVTVVEEVFTGPWNL